MAEVLNAHKQDAADERTATFSSGLTRRCGVLLGVEQVRPTGERDDYQQLHSGSGQRRTHVFHY